MTKAFESAVGLLTRREHGALELSNKLEQKGFNQKEIKDALETCQDLGLQSDDRFVEHYVRSRIRQGYGPLKISQELKVKGIDKELIFQKLKQEENNWQDHALKVWEKKNRKRKDLSWDEIKKLQAFLLYRGFTIDIITKVAKTCTCNCSITGGETSTERETSF